MSTFSMMNAIIKVFLINGCGRDIAMEMWVWSKTETSYRYECKGFKLDLYEYFWILANDISMELRVQLKTFLEGFFFIKIV